MGIIMGMTMTIMGTTMTIMGMTIVDTMGIAMRRNPLGWRLRWARR